MTDIVTTPTNGKPVKRKVGRPPAIVDLDKVREYAAEGLPEHAIANKLGIHANTFSRLKGRSLAEFEGAIKEGRGSFSRDLQNLMWKQAQTNPPMAMFIAKQEHTLNYSDQRKVETHVTVDYQVKTGILDVPPPIDITPDRDDS